jgi:hypothetical protein
VDDDEIGYRKPPKRTRFQKGKSGNPSGRPKRADKPFADLMAELDQVVEVTEGGRRRRFTKLRLLYKSLTNSAIKGDTRAANILIALSARAIEAGKLDASEAMPSDQDLKIVEDFIQREFKARAAQQSKAKDDQS